MKSLILSLLILISAKSFGQDLSSQLAKSWKTLTVEIQNRNSLIINLTSRLSKISSFNKVQLSNLNAKTIDLDKNINLTSLDSLSISILEIKKNKIILPLLKLQLSIEKNKKLRSDKETFALLLQLESGENRIGLAKKEYNEYCLKEKRTDLQFSPDEIKEASKVEF